MRSVMRNDKDSLSLSLTLSLSLSLSSPLEHKTASFGWKSTILLACGSLNPVI